MNNYNPTVSKFILAAFAAVLLMPSTSVVANDKLFQFSTIDALIQGVFDGEMTLGTLRKEGDFALGTINQLDGELIGLDGVFYQVNGSGKVVELREGVMTPFAVSTHFVPETQKAVSDVDNYDTLKKRIDAWLPTKNYFYAIRIDGRFKSIRVRSLLAQHAPYQPLVEVVRSQPIWDYSDVEGTLVGFRCPEFARGVNVPGYHFHFLSRDKTKGGHVLELQMASGTVAIDVLKNWEVKLPSNKEFTNIDLSGDQSEAVKAVEQKPE